MIINLDVYKRQANQFLLDTENTQGQLKAVENRRLFLSGDVEETQKKADDLRKEYDALEEKLSKLDEKMCIRDRVISWFRDLVKQLLTVQCARVLPSQ